MCLPHPGYPEAERPVANPSCTGVSTWGGDLYTPCPPPLFAVQLVVANGALEFQPSLAELESAVLGVLEAVIAASADVDDIAAKVGGMQ